MAAMIPLAAQSVALIVLLSTSLSRSSLLSAALELALVGGPPLVNGLAVALAAALLIRGRGDDQSHALALFVVLLPLFQSALSLQIFSGAWDPYAALGWLWHLAAPHSVLLIASPWFALGAFLRFTAMFPRAYPRSARSVSRWSSAWMWIQRCTARSAYVWVTVVVLALLSVGADALLGSSANGSMPSPAGSVRQAAWLSLYPMVLLLAGYAGVRNLTCAYRNGRPLDRRRIRWLFFGVTAAFWMAALGVAIWVLLSRNVGTVITYGVPLTVILGIYLAVFYDGAVDASLAIERTTLYGAAGVTFLFFFAGLENVLSAELERRFGVSGAMGAMISGGLAAVLIVPLRRRMRVLGARLSSVVDDSPAS